MSKISDEVLRALTLFGPDATQPVARELLAAREVLRLVSDSSPPSSSEPPSDGMPTTWDWCSDCGQSDFGVSSDTSKHKADCRWRMSVEAARACLPETSDA